MKKNIKLIGMGGLTVASVVMFVAVKNEPSTVGTLLHILVLISLIVFLFAVAVFSLAQLSTHCGYLINRKYSRRYAREIFKGCLLANTAVFVYCIVSGGSLEGILCLVAYYMAAVIGLIVVATIMTEIKRKVIRYGIMKSIKAG